MRHPVPIPALVFLILSACSDYGLGSKVAVEAGEHGNGTVTVTSPTQHCDQTASVTEVGPLDGEPTCSAVDAGWDIEPEWEYEEESADSAYGPLIASMDGSVVVLVRTTAGISVLDGGTGALLRTFEFADSLEAGSSMGVMDVNRDQSPDIAAPADPGTHPGQIWLIDATSGVARLSSASEGSLEGAPSFFDVDQDGVAEVVAESGVYPWDGGPVTSFRLSSPDMYQYTGHYQSTAAIYRAGETVLLANRGGIWDASSAAREVDLEAIGILPTSSVSAWIRTADGKDAIIADAATLVRVSDVDGVVWRLEDDTIHQTFGTHAIATGQIFGDTEPEVCIGTRDGLVVLDADGVQVWAWAPDAGVSETALDYLGYTGGCALADLDADGYAEIIDQSSAGLSIHHGGDGALLVFDPRFATKYPGGGPVVGDIDGDGSAEVVVTYIRGPISYFDSELGRSVAAIGATDGRWAKTRPVWNQVGYDAESVTAAGALRLPDEPVEQEGVGFREQPAVDGDLADLRPVVVNQCSDPCSDPTIWIEVIVENRGSAEATSDIAVSMSQSIDGVTQVLASGTVPTPLASMSRSAGLVFAVTPIRPDLPLYLDVDSSAECDRSDNRTALVVEVCAE